MPSYGTDASLASLPSVDVEDRRAVVSEQPPKKSIWPWVTAALLLVFVSAAFWYLHDVDVLKHVKPERVITTEELADRARRMIKNEKETVNQGDGMRDVERVTDAIETIGEKVPERVVEGVSERAQEQIGNRPQSGQKSNQNNKSQKSNPFFDGEALEKEFAGWASDNFKNLQSNLMAKVEGKKAKWEKGDKANDAKMKLGKAKKMKTDPEFEWGQLECNTVNGPCCEGVEEHKDCVGNVSTCIGADISRNKRVKVCVACGENYQPCCESTAAGQDCEAGSSTCLELTYREGGGETGMFPDFAVCVACGTSLLPCCEGNKCGAGLSCFTAGSLPIPGIEFALCAPCGEEYGICCPDKTCNAGLSCKNMTLDNVNAFMCVPAVVPTNKKNAEQEKEQYHWKEQQDKHNNKDNNYRDNVDKQQEGNKNYRDEKATTNNKDYKDYGNNDQTDRNRNEKQNDKNDNRQQGGNNMNREQGRSEKQ